MGFIEQKTFIINDINYDWKFFKLNERDNKLNSIKFEDIQKNDIITVFDLNNKCPIPFNYSLQDNVNPFLKVLYDPYFSLDLPEGTMEIECISVFRVLE